MDERNLFFENGVAEVETEDELRRLEKMHAELIKSNLELAASVTKLAAEKVALEKIKDEGEYLKARKESLQKEFEELRQKYESDLEKSAFEEINLCSAKMEAARIELHQMEDQHKVLCDKMEDVVKDYRAFNVKIKTLETKVVTEKDQLLKIIGKEPPKDEEDASKDDDDDFFKDADNEMEADP